MVKRRLFPDFLPGLADSVRRREAGEFAGFALRFEDDTHSAEAPATEAA
jgi:hypothetical protein